mmetsp:Transcript_24477/g.39192  ORF Transcript_24477/g.39192 Transcript_24477/m.39192 type:complete len:560 (-) Transcript_24477:487-2166(-)
MSISRCLLFCVLVGFGFILASSDTLERVDLIGTLSDVAVEQAIRIGDRVEAGRQLEEGGEAGGESKEAFPEEEKIDETSLTVAFLLIGIVAFVSTLFYLVNYDDPQIQDATWDLLSDALSIFCAVLWFQAQEALFDDWFEEESKGLRVFVSLCHFFVWYGSVQVVSITLCASPRCGHLAFKASCTLGAHLSGFAAKSTMNDLMQAEPFRDSVGMAIVSFLISIVSLFTFMVISYLIRNYIIYPTMAEKDKKVCAAEIQECENDMCSLSFGFCISQILRYALHGKLPTEELDEKDDHKQWQAYMLGVFAILFACIGVLLGRLEYLYGESWNYHWRRSVLNAKLTCVMTMAWNLLFFGQWEIFDTHLVKRPLLARVILALILSYVAMALIFGFDFIADRAKQRILKKGARLLSAGFGLAVAFAWEASFDASVEDIAKAKEMGLSEAAAKVLLAGFLVIVVAPAWGMYVLPKSLGNEEKEAEKDKEDKEAKGIRQGSKEKRMEGGEMDKLTPAPIGSAEPTIPPKSSEEQALRDEPKKSPRDRAWGVDEGFEAAPVPGKVAE